MSEYSDRVIQQSLWWVNGKPKHNVVNDQCVVDFSCCHPELFTEDLEQRMKKHKGLIELLRGLDRE